jgi:PAS domain S-box-containing protein
MLLSSTTAYAASALQFDHITADDGLPNNWVQAVTKDSRGFMWIGTQDGLVRYDAGAFVSYRRQKSNPNGLPFPAVRLIFEDSRKDLWVGSFTGDGGLARLDATTGRFQSFMPDGTNKNPVGAQAEAMLEDERGHLWIATGKGLSDYDPATQTFISYLHDPANALSLPNDTVRTVAKGAGGRIWVGTQVGVARIDSSTGRFEEWAARDEPLRSAMVQKILADRDGTLWVATLDSGVHHLDPSTNKVTRYTHDPKDPTSLSTNRTRCLAKDNQGLLYIGTENGGLDVLDTATGRFTNYLPDIDDPRSLNSASIYDLYFDDQGVLWIGTFNGGLNVVSPPGQRFETLRARRGGLSNSHVASIVEDHTGDLWVGTDGGGLNRRDAATGRWRYYTHSAAPGSIGSDAILSLVEDRNHTLWIGGWDAGLAYYDRAADRFVVFRHRANDPDSLISDHIFGLLPLSTGLIAFGTLDGIGIFDPKTRKASRPQPLRDEPVGTDYTTFSIAEDRKGDVWFGRRNRVDVIDRAGRLRTYRHDPNDPNSLHADSVRDLQEDSRGNMWIATDDGLNVVAAGTGTMRRFTTDDGLPHGFVDAILEDGSENIWISTNGGVAKLEKGVTLPTKPSFQVFDRRDGLQGSEFIGGAGYKSPSGRLYFGGPRGLNSFVPENIGRNLVPPPVRLIGLKIFNKPVVVGAPGSPLHKPLADTEQITLSYKQSMVTLEYAALNYLTPEKNRFAYRLEGIDPEWNDVGTQRTATYPSLVPGSYTFRVRAWNNDGILNEKGAALRIVITPPYWQTWWFRLAVLLTVAGGLVLAYRRRVRQMVERRLELEMEVERRTTELQQRTADLEALTGNLQSEILERQEAERRLEQQTQEAHDSAVKLAETNSELVDKRDALEKENTERRRAEEQAGRERDLLHTLMDNIPDFIYFKDTASRLTRINRAHATLLGVENPAQAEGKTDADFLPTVLAHGSRDDEREIFSTGRPLVGKLEHDPRSGRWLLSTKVPTRAETGEITGLVGISKDITERKQAEERLARDLAAFREMVDFVALGDLTRRGIENDETVGQIARAVNGMLEGFSGILLEMREAAFAVAASSTQILATSTQIAKGAEIGSEKVHATSASVEEMAASMSLVSKNAEMSAENARRVLEHVHAGDRAVQANYEGMTKVNDAAADTAEKMKLLEQRSREVFDIIDMIEEIGTQSKLLSLNAAIEAAHAGEAGRGFAVVADEVRRLADKSGEATKQVARRIDAIVEETQGALKAMQNSMREIKAGWILSQEARSQLEKISSLVQASVDTSLQIASASQEQTLATREVASAMESIALFTEGSAHGATETSKSVRDLVQLSHQLNQTMKRFKIDGAIAGMTPIPGPADPASS